MSSPIGARQAQSHDVLAGAAKLAWHTFYGMQKASQDFENLRFDVWTLAISLDAVHNTGSTLLLLNRQPDYQRWMWAFSKILNSVYAVLRPLYNLVRLYLSTSPQERTVVKRWLAHKDVEFNGATVQDFRRKLSLLVEALNIFLSSLTHAELGRVRASTNTADRHSGAGVPASKPWDTERSVYSIERDSDGRLKSVYSVALSAQELKEAKLSPTSDTSQDSGDSNPQSTPSPEHHPSPHTTDGGDPHPNPNLEGIETDFRRHMHTMRRIKEQLLRQKGTEEYHMSRKLARVSEAMTSPRSPTHARASPEHDNQENTKPTTAKTVKLERLASPSVETNTHYTIETSEESNKKRSRSSDNLCPDCSEKEEQEHARDPGRKRSSESPLEQMLTAAIAFDS
jgi:hypothetical protein